MDVVYVVRDGDQNPELRHSIRSVVEYFGPLSQLVIAGYTPSWLHPDISIPVLQLGSKYRRAEANLIAAATNPKVSDPFLYMNDDMYFLSHMDHVPYYSLGPMDDVIAYYRSRPGGKGTYLRGMTETRELLQHHVDRDLLSYEAHTPIELSKDRLLDVLSFRPEPLDDYHWRTVYGAFYVDKPHVLEHDVKVYMHTPEGWDKWPLLSTSDSTFLHHPVGKHLRAMFPTPSRYEV
jgi:hypothetical protein